MAETSAFTESMSESRVVKGVRGAIEGVQQGNKEYWEIRQTIQDRLKWHGGGVYRAHVERMERVIKVLYDKKDAGFWDKMKQTGFRFSSKVEGRILQVSSATADLFYNFIRWFPFGIPAKLLPIPKDVFKRMALGLSDLRVRSFGSALGALKTWESGVEGIRKGAAAVVTAPEVASTMLKRRVDYFVDQIKNPHPVGIETKPNMPFRPK